MTPRELISWAEERHNYYCRIGSEYLQKNKHTEIISPRFELNPRRARVAGWARYGRNECCYNLPYLLSEGENFEQTIAHEVAHFVVYEMSRQAKSHGDLFMYVLNHVFLKSPSRHHYYKKPSFPICQLAALLFVMRKDKEYLKCAAETENPNA